MARERDLQEGCPLELDSDDHLLEGAISTKAFTFSRERINFLYSCLRAKNGHRFWNSDAQPIKGIVFELFENLCGKIRLVGDLTIDHRIGFVNSCGQVINFSNKVSLQHCVNTGT